jgi:hypothetical protein
LESSDEVVRRVIQFRRAILNREEPALLRSEPLSAEDEVA